jgi:prophage DNA circulation protein
MIYTDSRYATGTIYKAHDSRKNVYSAAVARRFPIQSTKFYHYNWVENDRIDAIAHEFLGASEFWWTIMDFNPEINDPFDIPVGTTIRIPYV